VFDELVVVDLLERPINQPAKTDRITNPMTTRIILVRKLLFSELGLIVSLRFLSIHT